MVMAPTVAGAKDYPVSVSDPKMVAEEITPQSTASRR